MVITKIEKQKKNAKRVSLFVDDEFKCGLFEDTAVKYGLNSGDVISKELLDELINFDEYLFAKKSAYNLLSYRARSIREIKDKLKQKKVSGRTIERTITHLKELGLLNDEDFAKQFISDYMAKSDGPVVLRQKLFKKGVSNQIAEKVLNDIYKDSDERKIANDVFNKYSKKLKIKDIIQKKRKIFNYLARKGFDFDLINDIINEKLK